MAVIVRFPQGESKEHADATSAVCVDGLLTVRRWNPKTRRHDDVRSHRGPLVAEIIENGVVTERIVCP